MPALALLPALLVNLAASADVCRPVSPVKADSVVAYAIAVTGLDRAQPGLRASSATHYTDMTYQSDRQYPPTLWGTREIRVFVDWAAGAHRVEQGTAPAMVAFLSDSARSAIWSPRGAMLMPAGGNALDERALDAWTVLTDWRSTRDAVVRVECIYRDAWRLVAERDTRLGRERLFLDAKTGFPVKLDRRERHYLWGDVLAEYVWSGWSTVRGSTTSLAPMFAFRLVDGALDEQRAYTNLRFVPVDSVASLGIPAEAMPAPPAAGPMPDTTRVGPNTFLLRSRNYNNVVTLQRDTVFVFDAQLGGDRAQQDSVWIGRLFPGKHPVAVIVSDVAWPHITGVRYWQAMGATIYTHRLSQPFLDRVMQRRWTLRPDELEGRRELARAVRVLPDAAELAGGAIRVRTIDGIGSEGALMAFIPSEQFLYAGDFIQSGAAGFIAVYAREVAAAVARAGFQPARFAAMHTPLTAWTDIARFTRQ